MLTTTNKVLLPDLLQPKGLLSEGGSPVIGFAFNLLQVVVILPTNRKDRYDSIKKLCCKDNPGRSLWLLEETLNTILPPFLLQYLLSAYWPGPCPRSSS
jgi:hypothetical protein